MKRILVLAGLALLAGGARAADPVTPGTPLALVGNEKVQKELGLSAAQAEAVKKISDEADRGKTTEAHRDLARELKPAQLKRLREVSYQLRGGSALLDPDVAKAVDLTEKQKAELQGVWDNEEKSLKMILAVARFRNPQVMQKFILEQRRGAGQKMLDRLSAEQKKAFATLQGKPFDMTGLFGD